jgi:hypothetical protein
MLRGKHYDLLQSPLYVEWIENPKRLGRSSPLARGLTFIPKLKVRYETDEPAKLQPRDKRES